MSRSRHGCNQVYAVKFYGGVDNFQNRGLSPEWEVHYEHFKPNVCTHLSSTGMSEMKKRANATQALKEREIVTLRLQSQS